MRKHIDHFAKTSSITNTNPQVCEHVDNFAKQIQTFTTNSKTMQHIDTCAKTKETTNIYKHIQHVAKRRLVSENKTTFYKLTSVLSTNVRDNTSTVILN